MNTPQAGGPTGLPGDEKRVPVLYLDIDDTVRKGFDHLGRFVNKADDVVVFPEAVVMMKRWKSAGGRIVGVSNQGGVALGHVSLADAAAALMRTHVLTGSLFDAMVWCSHHPKAASPEEARCWCRKPSPGLVIGGAHKLAAEHPDEMYPPYMGLMVGDRDEDRQCAELAGLDFQDAEHWRSLANLG